MSTRAVTRSPLGSVCLLALVGALLSTFSVSSLAAAPPSPATSSATSSAPSPCADDNLLRGATLLEPRAEPAATALLTDGTIAAEGTDWDASPAFVLPPQITTMVFDLGRVQSLQAIYLQADANDVYSLRGGTTEDEARTRVLATADDVLATAGPGLHARWLTFAPTAVRFLRVQVERGDGAYSVSEIGAYCRALASPPVFGVAATPAKTLARPAVPVDAPQPRDGAPANRTPLLIFGAALAALALFLGRPWERQRHRPTTGEVPGHGFMVLLFFASGCAALIYEVVWFHLLRLVIGASSLSVGIVLASFMGGMFLGSLFFSRVIAPNRNPIRVYAALELGVGLFGLAMPALLPAMRSIYVGLVGYGSLGIALRAVVATLLLLPPTALMGATLPAVARRYREGRRGMSALASLYAANTAGAVLGCLLAGFVLLAWWDVWVTTLTAVALNFGIAALAWGLSQRLGATVSASAALEAAPSPAASRDEGTFDLGAVYVGVALSGFTALGAQVVWTRLLTLLFGATVYAFAIILAIFLAGLGLGSAFAARLIRRGGDAARALAQTQLWLVPALSLSSFLLADVLPYGSPAAGTPIAALHALQVLRAIDVILPGAVLWGMSFPLALAAAARGAADRGQSSGRVYAANTVGAILGSLLVSFLVIPRGGTRGALGLLVVVAAASAAYLFGARREAKSRPWVLGALALGAVAFAVQPGLSRAFLAHGRYIWWVDPRDQYLFVSEGAASTVAVHVAPDGFRNFHVSGRVEASNNPNDMRLQRLLGHLSGMAHPHPESVLVVGLGAGVTAGALALHPEVKRIVICEIEPRVVGAAMQFGVENHDVLTDPRVQIVFDDARHFLATTRERFDIITSDPIHPWVRGNSVLFSREYYEIVRSHLQPGGIATQWVPLYETSEEAIKIQMRTFVDAFPHGTVWNSAVGGNGYDVVLLGAEAPLTVNLDRWTERLAASPAIGEALRQVKIRSAVELAATYATRGEDMQTWLTGTPVNRDFSLRLEYISGLALNEKAADPIYVHMTEGRSFPDELFKGSRETVNELRLRLKAPRLP